MFKLFKRKNEVKELKSRVEALEVKVIVLNSQIENYIDFSKSWGDEFNLKGFTIDDGLIKNSKFSADKVSCGNCNKEAVVPLENTEFISKLAKELSSVFEENQKDKVTGDLILQIDGSVIGKIALNQIKKMQREGRVTVIPV